MARPDPRIAALERMLRATARAFRERVAADTRHRLTIPRVFATSRDIDDDEAPDALVGVRLRPRTPLGGSAIALPEPDEDLTADVLGHRR